MSIDGIVIRRGESSIDVVEQALLVRAGHGSMVASGFVVGGRERSALLEAWDAHGGGDVSERERLGALLEQVVRQGRDAWPGFEVPDATMIAALVDATDDRDPLETLTTVRAGDLYLARGCVDGNSSAIAEFERLCRPEIDRALAKLAGSRELRDDLEQMLRERLIVGTSERPPRLIEFRGHSALARWVRVVVSRLAIDLGRGRGRFEDPTSDAALLERLDASEAPEVGLLRTRYGADFKAALEAAVDTLSPRDSRLLRDHLVFDISTAKLAKLHGASKSSVARWIAAARERVATQVRVALRERYGDTEELRSVLRLVRSDLQLSLARILGRDDPTSP